jgi:hypothetical protein
VIRYEDVNLFADLAAERPLAAERGERKIVVEVKSFLGPSPMHDLQLTPGQYQLYRGPLELTAPDRSLYLAVPDTVYNDFLVRNVVQLILQRYNLSLMVVNPRVEEIVQWIDS